jgi:hypothetical protein
VSPDTGVSWSAHGGGGGFTASIAAVFIVFPVCDLEDRHAAGMIGLGHLFQCRRRGGVRCHTHVRGVDRGCRKGGSACIFATRLWCYDSLGY